MGSASQPDGHARGSKLKCARRYASSPDEGLTMAENYRTTGREEVVGRAKRKLSEPVQARDQRALLAAEPPEGSAYLLRASSLPAALGAKVCKYARLYRLLWNSGGKKLCQLRLHKFLQCQTGEQDLHGWPGRRRTRPVSGTSRALSQPASQLACQRISGLKGRRSVGRGEGARVRPCKAAEICKTSRKSK